MTADPVCEQPLKGATSPSTTTTISSTPPSTSTITSSAASSTTNSPYLNGHSASPAKQPLRHTAQKLLNRAKANHLVKFGTDIVKPFASPVVKRLQPALITVQHLSDPMLNSVDERLASALEQLPELRRRLIVESAWFQQVNAILLQSTSRAEIKENVQRFWTVAMEQFIQMASKGRLMKDEFLQALKQQLNSFWDEALVQPAEHFFEQAKQYYAASAAVASGASAEAGQRQLSLNTAFKAIASVRTQLDAKIEAIYQQRLRQPARQLYDAAVKKYMSLTEPVSVTDFIASIRAHLGSAWNDRLEAPLRELWSKLNQWSRKDLEKLHSYLDQDKDGLLSIGDMFQSSRVASTTVVKRVQGLVHYTWQGVLGKTQKTIDKTIDFVLPDKSGSMSSQSINKRNENGEYTDVSSMEEVKDLSLRSIRSEFGNRIKGRVKSRIYNGYSTVKSFSATRVAPIVHLDPVQLGENLITKQAKPVVVSAHAKVDHLVKELNTRAEAAQHATLQLKTEALETGHQLVVSTGVPACVDYCRDAMHETRDALIEMVQAHIPEPIKQFRPSLAEKLTALKQASIELSVHSSHLLIHEPVRKLPGDVTQIIKSLPTLVFAHEEIKQENDPTGMLQKVDHLLDAVKGLIFWSKQDEQQTNKEISEEIARQQQLAKEAQVCVEEKADIANKAVEEAKNTIPSESANVSSPVVQGAEESVAVNERQENGNANSVTKSSESHNQSYKRGHNKKNKQNKHHQQL